jgi:hypothetical protein
MKNTTVLFVVSVLFASCTGNTLDGNTEKDGSVYSICDRLPDVSGLGLYPFIPFTTEEMQTVPYQTKLEQRQIPEDYLRKMTTEALFYQFVYCDLSGGLYAWNTLQTGFENMVKQLNMLPELLSRSDAGNVLLEILENVKIAELKESDCFHFYHCIEHIVAQPAVINSMTDAEISRYVSLQMRKQETIRELATANEDLWSYPESLGSILYGLGNVMFRYDFAPFRQLLETDQEIDALMFSAMVKNDRTVKVMNECVLKFVER